MTLKEAVTDTAADSSAAEALDGEKPMRADARRNRERLITAAREVFAEQGANASMEAIAKHAGVGVGTLYRHFPTRMDVVEAVYESDVEELSEAARPRECGVGAVASGRGFLRCVPALRPDEAGAAH